MDDIIFALIALAYFGSNGVENGLGAEKVTPDYPPFLAQE
jgi:hypothetical protein